MVIERKRDDDTEHEGDSVRWRMRRSLRRCQQVSSNGFAVVCCLLYARTLMWKNFAHCELRLFHAATNKHHTNSRSRSHSHTRTQNTEKASRLAAATTTNKKHTSKRASKRAHLYTCLLRATHLLLLSISNYHIATYNEERSTEGSKWEWNDDDDDDIVWTMMMMLYAVTGIVELFRLHSATSI